MSSKWEELSQQRLTGADARHGTTHNRANALNTWPHRTGVLNQKVSELSQDVEDLQAGRQDGDGEELARLQVRLVRRVRPSDCALEIANSMLRGLRRRVAVFRGDALVRLPGYRAMTDERILFVQAEIQEEREDARGAAAALQLVRVPARIISSQAITEPVQLCTLLRL